MDAKGGKQYPEWNAASPGTSGGYFAMALEEEIAQELITSRRSRE